MKFSTQLFPETPLQRVRWPITDAAGVHFFVKREDLINPYWSGNKWYKLRGNVDAMKSQNKIGMVSFGGGYSNHLHALAYCGKALQIPTVGIVRGDYRHQLTPTLRDCEAAGMTLRFVDRKTYAQRYHPTFAAQLDPNLADYWVIPEGGANREGVLGCQVIAQSIQHQLDQHLRCFDLSSSSHKSSIPTPFQVFVPCGTATTLMGLISSLPEWANVHGVSVLKGEDTLTERVKQLLLDYGIKPHCQWSILTGYHSGGYGKFPPDLKAFMQAFEAECGFLLDPIYTVKMMRAIAAGVESGRWSKGDVVVAIHTGGLQGRRGYDLPM
ncbi:1-aminocyclopropane-1-carboxylate deaminase/D-cysteine desulfhydrase [Marinibactrum halimedae]|uniref:1-aminocyclopropane-1-carboxylate deaminase n=1 Tax=Marinibactrum halimedae TaxID=1444977 RepID=A0AA37TB41_9GAMM|nr:pyridoxal-phosphate dependent enzyme [Marinibactrum halimedae]MCD9459503.1 pyridoxal-phosphate dependent enzyme [Marinibactrum halimedae]GLS28157.1 1-aminocyclopropane-1-carboxylate deaminase [Marinibactrum halimedae]